MSIQNLLIIVAQKLREQNTAGFILLNDTKQKLQTKEKKKYV